MKKRILVIEKNKDILELINVILSEEGYELDLIRSENEVFNHIREFKPDAILLDIMQTTPEGTAICEAIKSDEETANIPVIVLSTHPRAEIFKEICADEVISKPFDISFLIHVLEQQLLPA